MEDAWLLAPLSRTKEQFIANAEQLTNSWRFSRSCLLNALADVTDLPWWRRRSIHQQRYCRDKETVNLFVLNSWRMLAQASSI